MDEVTRERERQDRTDDPETGCLHETQKFRFQIEGEQATRDFSMTTTRRGETRRIVPSIYIGNLQKCSILFDTSTTESLALMLLFQFQSHWPGGGSIEQLLLVTLGHNSVKA